MRHVCECVCVRALLGVESLSQFPSPEETDTEYDIIMDAMCMCMCYVCFNALLLAWVWTERFHFTNNKTKEVGSETVVVMLNTVQCLTLKERNFDGLAFPKTLV